MTFPLKKSISWFTNAISIPTQKNKLISKIGLITKGKGTAFLGELLLLLYNKKEAKPTTSSFSVKTFTKENTTKLYIHFKEKPEGVYHNIYYLNDQNEKMWLGKTPA
ncbi:hypothetical protein [uncultured Maribacter sp.]|uniref:hypothetical protein n=1 Tax=uncultured Maribacter sp. TaxID=431308 RepID=UPI0026287AA5|nr:hypothetical protein [uncultured Maribacter sp.]